MIYVGTRLEGCDQLRSSALCPTSADVDPNWRLFFILMVDQMSVFLIVNGSCSSEFVGHLPVHLSSAREARKNSFDKKLPAPSNFLELRAEHHRKRTLGYLGNHSNR